MKDGKSLSEEIEEGLEAAIEHEKGGTQLRETSIEKSDIEKCNDIFRRNSATLYHPVKGRDVQFVAEAIEKMYQESGEMGVPLETLQAYITAEMFTSMRNLLFNVGIKK